MLQFFKKWSESLNNCLRHGDLHTISAKTDLSYHQVHRIMKGEGKSEGKDKAAEREKTLKAANALIKSRSRAELSLADDFDKELILEKQMAAEKAVEAVQQLSGTQEDLVNF